MLVGLGLFEKSNFARELRTVVFLYKEERYFQLLALSLDFSLISTSFVPTLSPIFYDYCFHIDFLIAHMIRH